MSRNLVTGIVLTSILTISFVVTFYFLNINTRTVKAINVLPENTAIAIECNKLSLNFKLLSQTTFWRQMLSENAISKTENSIRYLDSLLSLNENFNRLKNECNTVLSLHPFSNGSIDILLVVETKESLEIENSIHWIFEMYPNRFQKYKRKFDGETIYDFTDFKTKKSFSIAYKNKLYIISENGALVEETLFKLKRHQAYEQSELNKVDFVKSMGDANLYLNFKILPKLLGINLKDEYKTQLQTISNIANWSVLGVTLSNNSIDLKGVSITHDSIFQFADLFRGTLPIEHLIKKQLPSNTAFYAGIACDNMEVFEKNLQEYYKMNSLTGVDKTYKDSINKVKKTPELQTKLKSIFANEIAKISIYNHELSFDSSFIVVTKIKNRKNALETILSIAEIDSLKNKDSINLETQVYKISLGKYLDNFWGDYLNGVEANYAVIWDNYILFANNQLALKDFTTRANANDKLIKNQHYSEHIKSLNSVSNIELFFHSTNFSRFANEISTEHFLESFNQNKICFLKSNYFSFQISSTNNKNYITNGQIWFDTEQHNKTEIFAEIKVDTSLVIAPQIVHYESKNNTAIAVQDLSKQLYLINNESEILWKIKVDGKIISKIYEVDAFKNGKIQYLFNTASQIYLLNEKGINLQGFPAIIPTGTNFSINVFDFNNDKTYHIFAASKSSKIWCYSISGKLMNGWNPKNLWNPVTQKIEGFSFDNKPIIYTLDTKGKVQFYTLNGKYFLDLKFDSTNEISSITHAVIDTGQLRFYFNNSKRNLFIKDFFTYKKPVQTKLNFPSNTIELYKPENEVENSFFVNQNDEIKVYNEKGTLKSDFGLSDSSVHQANLVYIKNEAHIAYLNKISGKIYLQNKDRIDVNSFPVKGLNYFTFGKLSYSNELFLLTEGINNRLLIYKVK